ncbi:MAG TPA: amino acid adenylation domain-containing protein [Polyangia bacterium]|nr:amino acid adenylation domain-containing protein [Polyangia bacterium]
MVLRRDSERGVELVVYLVLAGSQLSEATRRRLDALLARAELPASPVQVTQVPLRPDGAVDEELLCGLPVIDGELAERWAGRLREVAEIEEAVVLVAERHEHPLPLHLSDSVIDWHRRAPEGEAESPVPESGEGRGPEQRDAAAPSTAVLSLSEGEPLVDRAALTMTLPEVLRRAVAQAPGERLVFRQADGSEVTASYASLCQGAEVVLGGLRRLGVEPGAPVLFQLERNQDFITALWGCLLGGFVPVPLSVAPSYEQRNSAVAKLENAWRLLGRPLVLTGARTTEGVRGLGAFLDLPDWRVAVMDDLRGDAPAGRPDRSWHAARPDDVALMLLTSGSTGVPKAVMLSHRNILARSAGTAQMNGFTVEEVSLNWFPLDHVGGVVMFHLRDVYLGCRQIHAPTETVLEDPLRWLDWIDRYRVTLTWAPNFALGLINDQAEEVAHRRWDLSSLRFILNAGEAIVARTSRRFLELLAPHGLRGDANHPAWGMSETSSAVTYSELFSLGTTADSDAFVEVGAPIPGAAIRIVDAEDRPVSEGTTGRLQVRGLSVTRGYYERPDLNRESFTADGWFKTGDLGRMRAGRLTITGREKDVIIINGVNYYSHEIESVVEEVAGVAVSFTAACAVRSPGRDTDELAIFFCADEPEGEALLPLLRAVRGRVVRGIGINPDHLLPVRREEIPKTGIGKIQRAELRRRFEAGEYRALKRRIDLQRRHAHPAPAAPAQELVAYYVPRPGRSDAAVRSAWVQPQGADPNPLSVEDRFGRPSTCTLVGVAQLPRTMDGKGAVDVAALLEEHRRGGVDREAAGGQLRTAPENEMERRIAAVWQETLGVAHVGRDDNFFELGGHSLLAAQVIARLRRALGLELALKDLFATPTVAGLAQVTRQSRPLQAENDAIPRQPRRAAPESHRFPLSLTQQRLWFLEQWEPGNCAYIQLFYFRLRGPLVRPALGTALAGLVARHEALRTRFVSEEGRPVQLVLPPGAAEAPLPLPLQDLRDLPAAEREAEARRLAWEEARRPFALSGPIGGDPDEAEDPDQAPLLRARLLRLGDEEHHLLLTLHHLVIDGWSVGVLIAELGALYEAALRGVPARLPELPVQYGDFAVWQREWVQGERLQRELTYWRERLGGKDGRPPVLELPTDLPRPPLQRYEGARVSRLAPRALVEGIKALARRAGVTPFMVELGAFQTLLHRYSGQADIVVGSPVASRSRVELEPLIGFFANTLCLRTDLSGDPSFRELLGRVQESATGAYAAQDVPFEKLVEELAPERDLSRSPLFQVLFQSLDVPRGAVALSRRSHASTGQDASETRGERRPGGPGGSMRVSGASKEILLEQLEFDNGSAKFDLTLELEEQAEGLRLTAEFRTDLWRPETLRRLLGHYEVLLAEAVAHPERRLSELPLLLPEERHEQLVVWNDRTAPFPQDQCLHDLFSAAAARYPERTALVFEDVRMSYAELDRRTSQLAHHLRARGVGPEVRVAVCLERSADLIVALLGVLRAGGAYVPLDPSYPRDRLALVLEDARPPILLTVTHLQDRLPMGQGPMTGGAGVVPEGGYDVVWLDREAEAIAAQPTTPPAPGSAPSDLAYVIFTSGSTGRPKGIQIEHRSVVHLVTTTPPLVGVRDDDVWTVFHSFAFDFSVWEIWSPLTAGGTLVVVPERLTRAPAELYRLLGRERVTVLDLTPVALRQLLGAREEARRAGQADDVVRLLFVGGEALPRELAEAARGWGVPLWNFYGPTEATVWASIYRVDDQGRLPGREAAVPIGRPLPDVGLYVLDRHFEPVPPGVLGELCIGGVGLARGYLDRPELTAAKFVPHPFAGSLGPGGPGPGAHLYRTGDLARAHPGGLIEFVGRADHQVKVRGFRIEAGDVEAALASHPAVAECVVVARPFKEGGGGERHLVAYLVPRAPAATRPPEEELRHHLRERLPEYMVPSVLVWIEALPLSPSGKIDRQALPAPDVIAASGGSGAVPRPELKTPYLAPREVVEQKLRLLWEEVLERRPIGVRDNFFDLGGHSLLAIELFARIEQAFDRKLPLATVFQAPTIERLAGVLHEQGWTPPWTSLVPIQPGGSKPAFFCVHGGGGHVLYYYPLARHLGPDQPFYGLQPRTLGGKRVPHPSLEEMAAHYLAEVRSLQPQGPYHLGGASYGGRIAFEMAQQLQAQGERVALLAMFDTYGPDYLKPLLHSTWARRMLKEVLLRLEHHAGSLILLPASDRLPYLQDKLRKARDEAAERVELLRDGIAKRRTSRHAIVRAPSTAGLPAAQAAELEGAQEVMVRALTEYRFRPLPGPGKITLFRARRQPPGIAPDPWLGWGGYAEGGIEIHEVPGYHAAMISEPRVRFLAEELRRCLERTQ